MRLVAEPNCYLLTEFKTHSHFIQNFPSEKESRANGSNLRHESSPFNFDRSVPGIGFHIRIVRQPQRDLIRRSENLSPNSDRNEQPTVQSGIEIGECIYAPSTNSEN